jgi:hypothetical protein
MKGGGFTTREREEEGFGGSSTEETGRRNTKQKIKALVDYYYHDCYTHRHLPVYSRRRHQLHTSRSRFTSVWLLHSTGPPVPPLVSLDSFCWCVFFRSFVRVFGVLLCWNWHFPSRLLSFIFQWHCVVLTYLYYIGSWFKAADDCKFLSSELRCAFVVIRSLSFCLKSFPFFSS